MPNARAWRSPRSWNATGKGAVHLPFTYPAIEPYAYLCISVEFTAWAVGGRSRWMRLEPWVVPMVSNLGGVLPARGASSQCRLAVGLEVAKSRYFPAEVFLFLCAPLRANERRLAIDAGDGLI